MTTCKKVVIVYYSRTGNTAKVANALAAALDAEVHEIVCDKYGSGALGYLRAGYDSVKGTLPTINTPEFSIEDFYLLLIGTPIWTSYPSLPIKAFLARNGALPANVGLFITCGGHSAVEAMINNTRTLLPAPIVASLALTDNQVHNSSFTDEISTFVNQLQISLDGLS